MFAQVCELDIIFNFEKAYFILDEFLMGGEIQDTSKKSVLKAIEQADLLQEVSWPSPPSRSQRLSPLFLSTYLLGLYEHEFEIKWKGMPFPIKFCDVNKSVRKLDSYGLIC